MKRMLLRRRTTNKKIIKTKVNKKTSVFKEKKTKK